MTLARIIVTPVLVGALLLMIGCDKGEPDTPKPAAPSGAEVVIPSQDEADAEAEAEITEENADAEFEALSGEIEAESDSDL